MIWNFWKKQEVSKPLVYDKLTDEYLNGDPKLIWQHQINGEKNFDNFDFTGALVELSNDPNWRGAFKNLPNSELFTKRLGEFFALKKAKLHESKEENTLYSFPRPESADEFELFDAAVEYLDFAIEIANKANEVDLKSYLEDIEVKLARDKSEEIKYDIKNIQIFDDLGSQPNTIKEVWHNLYENKRHSEWSHTHFCIDEACYGLSADHYIAYWLMQDFYTVNLDLSPYFNFFWRLNGSFYQENKIIYVFGKSVK